MIRRATARDIQYLAAIGYQNAKAEGGIINYGLVQIIDAGNLGLGQHYGRGDCRG